jgi:hypothetical protein
MATILQSSTLIALRNQLSETAIPVEQDFKIIEQECRKAADAIDKCIEMFQAKPEHYPHRVEERIITEKMQKTEALTLIHTSLYRLQDLVTEVQTKWFPVLQQHHNISKATLETARLTLKNNQTLMSMTPCQPVSIHAPAWGATAFL